MDMPGQHQVCSPVRIDRKEFRIVGEHQAELVRIRLSEVLLHLLFAKMVRKKFPEGFTVKIQAVQPDSSAKNDRSVVHADCAEALRLFVIFHVLPEVSSLQPFTGKLCLVISFCKIDRKLFRKLFDQVKRNLLPVRFIVCGILRDNHVAADHDRIRVQTANRAEKRTV